MTKTIRQAELLKWADECQARGLKRVSPHAIVFT